MRKKALSMLMGLVLGVTTIFSSVGTTGVTVYAAENGVTDADCTDKDTAAPTPDDTVPDANQYKYQKDELAAFCHFGPNTFNELEWGFNQSTQKKLYEGRTPDEIFTLESDFDAETLVNTLKNAGFKKLIVTAKHHDGFCIWNSAYTDYDIASYLTSPADGDYFITAKKSQPETEAGIDGNTYFEPYILYDDAAVHGGNHDYAYDYIKAKDYNGYDGGLKAFETASVSGVVWEDTNYNGIQDDGEAAYHNSKNPAVVHLQQYFYRDGEWVLENAAFRTHETKTDGTYTFSNLPSIFPLMWKRTA